MDTRQHRAVRVAIDVGTLLPAERGLVESSGDEGFDFVSTELMSRTLSSNQQVNALRALSLISRQFAPHRKPDLLKHALLLCESDDVALRSAAVHMAIWTSYSLEALGTRGPLRPMRAVVRRSLERGLTDSVGALANRFLRHEPPDIDIVELEIPGTPT